MFCLPSRQFRLLRHPDICRSFLLSTLLSTPTPALPPQRGAAKYKVPVCRDSRAWSQQRRRRSLLGRSEAGRTAAAVDTMALTEQEGADCTDIGEKLRQAGQ